MVANEGVETGALSDDEFTAAEPSPEPRVPLLVDTREPLPLKAPSEWAEQPYELISERGFTNISASTNSSGNTVIYGVDRAAGTLEMHDVVSGHTVIVADGLRRPMQVHCQDERVYFLEEGYDLQHDGRISFYDPLNVQTHVLMERLSQPKGLWVTPSHDVLFLEKAPAGERRRETGPAWAGGYRSSGWRVFLWLVSDCLSYGPDFQSPRPGGAADGDREFESNLHLQVQKRRLLVLEKEAGRGCGGLPDAVAMLPDGSLLLATRRCSPPLEGGGVEVWVPPPPSRPTRPHSVSLDMHRAEVRPLWVGTSPVRDLVVDRHGQILFAGCGSNAKGTAVAVGISAGAGADPLMLHEGFASCVTSDAHGNIFYGTGLGAGSLCALWARGSTLASRVLLRLESELAMAAVAAAAVGENGTPRSAQQEEVGRRLQADARAEKPVLSKSPTHAELAAQFASAFAPASPHRAAGSEHAGLVVPGGAQGPAAL